MLRRDCECPKGTDCGLRARAPSDWERPSGKIWETASPSRHIVASIICVASDEWPFPLDATLLLDNLVGNTCGIVCSDWETYEVSIEHPQRVGYMIRSKFFYGSLNEGALGMQVAGVVIEIKQEDWSREQAVLQAIIETLRLDPPRGLFSPTATRPPPPATTFGSGIWSVGKDIAPGTYRNNSWEHGCYWARLGGFSGELSDIIANSFSFSPQIVTIKSSDDGFESTGCGSWVAVDA